MGHACFRGPVPRLIGMTTAAGAPLFQRTVEQRLLAPDERACLTCLQLASGGVEHRPEHDQGLKRGGTWTALQGGPLLAGSRLLLVDDSWNSFTPEHGAFDSRDHLFRVEDGPLAGQYLYATVSVDWHAGEVSPPMDELWPDHLHPDNGEDGYA